MKIIFYKYWNLISIGILVLAAFWVVQSAIPPGSTTSGNIPAPMEGFVAPDFELTTLLGTAIKLSGYRGQVVMINFWASWCPPCRTEMPAMEEIYLGNESGEFMIFAVNGTHQDNLENVSSFVSDRNLSFPILMDFQGQISSLYQIRSLPTTFFVDRDGIIREIVIGGMDEALMRSKIENLIEEGS